MALLMGLEVIMFLGLLFHDYTITTFLNKRKLAALRKEFEDHFLEKNVAFLKKRSHQQRQCELNPDICSPPPEEDFISSYESEDSDRFLHLCTSRVSKWRPYYRWNKRKVESYKPEKQIQRLVFRRQEKSIKPVRLEMIRCTEKYALVPAEDRRSHYLLVKHDDPFEKKWWGIESETLFEIFTKFSLKEEKSEKGHIVVADLGKTIDTVDQPVENVSQSSQQDTKMKKSKSS